MKSVYNELVDGIFLYSDEPTEGVARAYPLQNGDIFTIMRFPFPIQYREGKFYEVIKSGPTHSFKEDGRVIYGYKIYEDTGKVFDADTINKVLNGEMRYIDIEQ